MLLHFLQPTVSSSMHNNIVRISVSFLCTFFVSFYFIETETRYNNHIQWMAFCCSFWYFLMRQQKCFEHFLGFTLRYPQSFNRNGSKEHTNVVFFFHNEKRNNSRNIVTTVSFGSWNTSRLIDNHGRIDTDFFCEPKKLCTNINCI